MRELRRLLGLVVVAFLLSTEFAHAAPFLVNSAADTVDVNPGDGVCADASGTCTLRAAIMEANALPGADTITLPAGTYTLTIPGVAEDAAATGDLDITDNLTINGAGAASTAIDGAALDRVLHVLSGTVAISGLTIQNGVAPHTPFSFGGGILNVNGSLTLTDSTVRSNSVGNGFGGGIANTFGALTLVNSTVSGNAAAAFGGGISNATALSLTNTTVSGNSAGNGGGGILNSGIAILTNSTVSNNDTTGSGGGVSVTSGTATLQNTIVANSVSGGNCAGAIASLGHNLSSDATCTLTDPTDLNSTNPLLGPLANNGGPTETHALLAGSPAVDAVPPASCLLNTDQRGVTRPQGPLCDIGAYEAAVTACLPPPSGMVAWWPFDEGAGATSFLDLIGGNNATLFASPLGGAQAPQPLPGVVSGAVYFPKFGNGLSGARVGPQGALATIGAADFTIDAWVGFPSGPANRPRYIVNKFDPAQNTGYAFYVISPGITGNERLAFTWGDGATVSTVQTIATLTAGQPHHVAVTFARNVGGNALDIRLYVDGIQQGQQTGNPPGLGSLVNFVFLEIGWQPGVLDEPIAIDELEIFDVALSLSDVQSIYNAGSAGKCKCTTGGQSVDLTVTGTGAVFGIGSGVAATVGNPLTINASLLGCSGQEMFLVVNAPALGISYSYYDGSTWVPLPSSLSQITPFALGPPNGTYPLFSGSLPPGTYDVYLGCDLFVNGHLDITGPPMCLSGAFDYLPLTVP